MGEGRLVVWLFGRVGKAVGDAMRNGLGRWRQEIGRCAFA